MYLRLTTPTVHVFTVNTPTVHVLTSLQVDYPPSTHSLQLLDGYTDVLAGKTPPQFIYLEQEF